MLKILKFLLPILFLSSCGYTFAGSGTVLPKEVRKIYIPNVQNHSPVNSLTLNLTESLKENFERYGVVTIVDTEEESDATLKVIIKSLKRGTRTSTGATDTAAQLDASLTISGVLAPKVGANLWEDNSIKITRSYGGTKDVVDTSSTTFASGGLNSSDLSSLSERELSRGQEEETLLELCDLASKKIYEDAVAADF